MDEEITQQRFPVSFTGTGGQFFKIWIVNVMLTALTLYIYSAWAKVRTKRYFYGNTVLDGSSFEYHAKPTQILLSRMIAAFLFIVVTVGGSFVPLLPVIATAIVFLIVPWAIWRSTKFNMRMTSYRNVRFGFDASLWPLYLYQLILPAVVYALAIGAFVVYIKWELTIQYAVIGAIAILSVNLILTAYMHKHLAQYFLNGYRYGKSRFSGTLSLGKFITTYLLACFLALGTLAALVIPYLLSAVPDGMGWMEWIESVFETVEASNSGGQKDDTASFIVRLVFFFYAYLFVVGYFVVALIGARVRNHVFANAVLDKRLTFESTMTSGRLWWVMFSNVLMTIISLGLARPYTQIRMARLLARHSAVFSATALNEFVGEKRQEVGAFGDELGDAFDMDMDVGF